MIKFIRKYTVILLLLLFAFTQHSCLKDLENIDNIELSANWNPDMAIPVLHARLSLMDFYSSSKLDSILNFDPSKLIIFNFAAKDINLYAKDIVPIPNQYVFFGPYKMNMPGQDSGLSGQSFSLMDTFVHNFNTYNKQEISKLILNDGQVKIDFNSNFNRSGTLNLIFPKISKNAIPLEINIPFDPSTKFPINLSDSVRLNGYTIRMKDDTSYNKIEARVSIDFDDGTSYIHKNDQALIKFSLENLDFSYFEGYLGQFNFNTEVDSLYIDLFKTISTGKVVLADPRFTLIVKNSMGMPMRITDPIIIGMSKDGAKQQLNSSELSVININYPELSQVGNTIKSELILDKNNSNIADVVKISPRDMSFDMPIKSNPDQKTYDNFVTDSSYVKIKRNMIFPFDGRTEAWNLDVKSDLNVENPDLLDYLQMNILIENGLPLDVKIQVYLADSNEIYLDSLFSANHYLAESGVIGSTGEVVSPTTKLTKIILDSDRLALLPDMRKIIVHASVATTENGTKNVKILSDYIFDIKIGVRAKLTVENL